MRNPFNTFIAPTIKILAVQGLERLLVGIVEGEDTTARVLIDLAISRDQLADLTSLQTTEL